MTITATRKEGLPYCDVWQIYYDKSQEKTLEPYASRYFVEGLSPFFENHVIAQHEFGLSKQYTGIFSHAYKLAWKNPAKHTITHLLENIGEYDAISPCGHWGKGDGYFQAMERFHPGALKIAEMLLSKMGLPPTSEVIVDAHYYFNAFIARTSVYVHYVEEFLKPAMELMETGEELRPLCWQDARYARTKGVELRMRMQVLLGVPYYPMHPFVLERMFAYWCKVKGYQIKAI